MQVVHKAFKAMLVFCLSLVMMVTSAQAAEACSFEPSYISFGGGSAEYLLVSDGYASSLDVVFDSREQFLQDVSFVTVDGGGATDNVPVPGEVSSFYVPGILEGAPPFDAVYVRVADSSWDIDLEIVGCTPA